MSTDVVPWPGPPGRPVVLVVMGVSGCGKSTVAALLADRLGWPSEEGDVLHPQANIDKMAAGTPSRTTTAGPGRGGARVDRPAARRR